jgi:hemolysin activation/secretion protein
MEVRRTRLGYKAQLQGSVAGRGGGACYILPKQKMERMKSLSLRLLFALMTIFQMAPAGAEAQPGDAIGHFDIARFEVEGSTLFDAAMVQSLVAPFVGPQRDFSDVEHAIDALEGAYRKRGFNLVKVILPEQELNAGVVRLQVVEVRIGKVNIDGNAFHDAANIRGSLPELREGAVPNTDRMSSSLHIANENPSKKTSVQMQSGGEPGLIDAVVSVVDEKTWATSLLFDNSGFDATGRNHVTLQFQNFNVGGLDHVFSGQYTTSADDPSKVTIFSAGYHIPLYALGDSLDFYGTYSNINAGTVTAGLVTLGVSGSGTVLGAHFNHDLPKKGNYESKLVAGFDHKAFTNDIDAQGTQLGGDVTVNPFSLSYIGEWALPSANLNFYVTGVHNVPGGSHASAADFDAARSGAPTSYALLRYGAGYNRALPRDWQLRFTLNGQAAHDALVPGEQFGIGGAASVRGLHERAINDDSGVSGSAEIYTPNLCGSVRGGKTQCRLLAFYDAGSVTRNDALPGEETHVSAGSTGAGLRLTSGKLLALQFDFGRVVSASDPQYKNAQRVHFQVALTY